MSLLSDFLAGGGGIKSNQAGFINVATMTIGASGEDRCYVDITIAPINPAKAVCTFEAAITYVGDSGGGSAQVPTTRLINSTTLRISFFGYGATAGSIVGRWKVIESN